MSSLLFIRNKEGDMSDKVQSIIDGAQFHMIGVLRQVYAGPAATCVLYSFVTVLARQLLTEEQQQQVQDILDLHNECVSRESEWE